MPAWMQLVVKSVLVSQVWWAQISSAAGRGSSGAVDRLPAEESGDEEHRDHRQTAAQVGQDELGQQGDGALAGLAQVAAHADDAVEGCVDERAGVEAMCGEWMLGVALRAVARAVTIGISQLLGILLHRAGERV